MRAENSYQDHWNEMVFENRNKDYGAYSIRKIYVRNVIAGLISSVVITTALILLPGIIAFFNRDNSKMETEVKRMIFTELTSPPPIETIESKRAASSKAATDKFLVPEITSKQIHTEVPAVTEVNNNIDTQTNNDEKGDTDGLIQGEGGKDYILDMAEIMPQYPGGMEALAAFISKNIRYPLSAQRMRLGGVVLVSFVVNTDGTIDEIHTVKGISEECDKEAERVVGIMPPWDPGLQENKPVKVRFVLPIKFRLGSLASVKKANPALLMREQ